jgi:RHS repeat-associated protein
VGQLITAVKEQTAAGDIWTSYAYDPLKQIVEVKDHLGNLTQAAYDNLGRRISLTNPDTGKTDFTFDLAGNLTTKVTATLKAAGQAIAYDYDFTRPKAVTYPVNPGNNVTYTYGAPGAPHNTAGRLIKTTSQMGSEERQYGKLGETVYEKKTVVTFTNPASPSVFETQYAFDTFGRLQTLTYPDGEILTNRYDAGGNLQSAEGAKGSFRYRYLTALHYDKFEQRVAMEQTNGVKTAYAYDPKTRRLNTLTAGRSGGTLFQNLSYGYDPVGNVLSLKNLTDSPTANDYGGPVFQQYQYDDLYRLTQAKGVFQYNRTGATPDATACNGSGTSHCRVYALDLTYDSIHNITAKHQTDTRYPPGASAIAQKKTSYNWTYAYSPSGATSTRPHAPTHIGELTYQYDANGNQLGWTHDQNGTRRTLVWNEDNRIHTLTDNGHEKAYKYDDAGTRVIKRGPQGETVYVNQFYTQRPGATGTKHVYAGTSRIASKLLRQDVPGANPAGKTPYEKDIYFYHPDHLGSSSYVTDLNGKLYEHLQYFPFGEGWIEENSNAQRTPYLFTAKELDEETGLYYFGARYYDPRTSVWQSADPILGKYLPSGGNASNLSGMGGIYNSFNLGLYSYGHLNPLKFVDPDGNESKFFFIIAVEYNRESPKGGAFLSVNIHDQGKNFTGIGINVQSGTNWLSRGVGPSGQEVAIEGGTRDFVMTTRENKPGKPVQPLLVGEDGKPGGKIPTLKPNPRQGNQKVADQIFLHGMNKNAAKNDPAHGGKDYMGSEGCQGTCDGKGSMSRITQGSEAGDTGTYTLIRPAETLDRAKEFVKSLE